MSTTAIRLEEHGDREVRMVLNALDGDRETGFEVAFAPDGWIRFVDQVLLFDCERNGMPAS